MRLTCVMIALAIALAALPGLADALPLDGSSNCTTPDAVDLEVSATTCGRILAISVQGDAEGRGGCRGGVSCISASGTGYATNTGGDFSCGSGGIGTGVGCVALSGTGDATNTAGGDSCGPATLGVVVSCVALSGTGDATNNANGANTSGINSCSAGQLGVGCVALSGTGNATNTVSFGRCGPGITGVVVGCVALSGTGDATNTAGNCGHGRLGAGLSCVALSGTGDATNTAGGDSCRSGDLGAGLGCVALSGTGSASNTVDGAPCMTHVTPSTSPGVGAGCVAQGPGVTAQSSPRAADASARAGALAQDGMDAMQPRSSSDSPNFAFSLTGAGVAASLASLPMLGLALFSRRRRTA